MKNLKPLTRLTQPAFPLLLGLLVGLLLLPAFLPVYQTAQAAPAAQLTPFPSPTAGPDGRILYIVQEGDTLWRISAITGVSLEQIRSLNRLENDVVRPGDILLLGYGGPLSITPTAGPSPTALPSEPTPTKAVGTGDICVILYDDLNGDGLRQESETWITNGQISINNRSGSFNESYETVVELDVYDDPDHHCFEELLEGEYTVSAAIPDGYNPTTSLIRSFELLGGNQTYISFGAQLNTEKTIEIVAQPVESGRSPLLLWLGGGLLLVGAAIGAYALLLSRQSGRLARKE